MNFVHNIFFLVVVNAVIWAHKNIKTLNKQGSVRMLFLIWCLQHTHKYGCIFYFWCMHKKICANAFSYFYCYDLVSRNFTLRTSSSILILIFSKWKTIINVIIIHKIQLLHNNHFFTSGLTTIITKNVNVSKPNICTLLWWKALASCCNCIRKIKMFKDSPIFFSLSYIFMHAHIFIFFLCKLCMFTMLTPYPFLKTADATASSQVL